MTIEKIRLMKDYLNECTVNDTLYEDDITLDIIKIAKDYIDLLEAENETLKIKERIYVREYEELKNMNGGEKR